MGESFALVQRLRKERERKREREKEMERDAREAGTGQEQEVLQWLLYPADTKTQCASPSPCRVPSFTFLLHEPYRSTCSSASVYRSRSLFLCTYQ